MILTAHQPVYLPWLGLFHKIALSDSFCYFDDVQYQVRDWNNRNKIKTFNGELMLTVPVLTKGYLDKKICQIEINNDSDWRRKHWKTISLAYQHAPHFKDHSDFFGDVYQKEWTLLSDLNEYMLKYFMEALGIHVQYAKASELGFEGAKSDLVLDMCKKLKADIYIFGALGKDYADAESFNSRGVKLYFQDYQHPEYKQIGREFLKYMSVIDLLFNVSKTQALDVIMSGNITKEELLKL
jgi:hypothetical protein